MEPHATAKLAPLSGARRFELAAIVTAEQLARLGPISVKVAIDGAPLGTRRLTGEGQQIVTWPAPESGPEHVMVEIDVQPEYRPSNGDTRRLGLAVMGFGFR
jgi:hypothetical protein